MQNIEFEEVGWRRYEKWSWSSNSQQPSQYIQVNHRSFRGLFSTNISICFIPMQILYEISIKSESDIVRYKCWIWGLKREVNFQRFCFIYERPSFRFKFCVNPNRGSGSAVLMFHPKSSDTLRIHHFNSSQEKSMHRRSCAHFLRWKNMHTANEPLARALQNLWKNPFPEWFWR